MTGLVLASFTDHVGPSRPVEEESIWVNFEGDKAGLDVGVLNTQMEIKKNKTIRWHSA